jgi:replicative DNA helicase
LNKDENIEILSFEYEMLASDQILRSLSGNTGLSSEVIQSSNGKELSDEDLKLLKIESANIIEYPIYYVDSSGTVPEMQNTIFNFILQRDFKEEKKSLIVTIDHVILTKGNTNDAEKKIIDDLYKMLLDTKKRLTEQGIRCLFICVSQLNRDIESVDRKKPSLNYPTQSDLFGASSVYHASDYVLISHNPSTLSGLERYGPPLPDYPEGLPLYCSKTNKAMIYWHLIKNRFGRNRIMIMRENFINSRVEEA